MSNKPTRVLQIIPDMRSGGAENFIMNLYRDMDRSQVQFDFAVHYHERRFFDDEIEKLGGKIYRFSLRDDKRVFKFIYDLDRFYKQHQEYKIIHCHWNGVGVFHLAIAKKNGIKVRIGHSHNSSAGIGIKGRIKTITVWPYKYFTTHNFACSDLAGKFLFGKKPFTFIPNAINTDRFIFNPIERNRIRCEFGLDEEDILLGNVGRFTVQKNHSFLIEIFSEFHKKRENSYLLLLGEGELMEQVKEQVIKYNLREFVIFAGVHSDTENYYSAMDMFLLPSLYEGLPVTAVEAQASGLPTLLSSTITKQVKLTNEVYYINNKAEEWCEIIDRIIDNEVDRSIMNEVVSKSDFNMTQIADYFQKLYVRESFE